MKKLFLIALGLVSFNVYANGCPGQFDAATGICRFQGNNGEWIHYNIAPPQPSRSTPPPKKSFTMTSWYLLNLGLWHTVKKQGILPVR